MKILSVFAITLILVLGIVSCSNINPDSAATVEKKLTVVTHDSFSISDQVIQNFEQETNIKVQFLSLGDAGAALNKIILSKEVPLGDVFFGLDNTFLSRAIEEDIFEIYKPPLLDKIPESYQLDPESRALPVDYGDVCPNFDIKFLKDQNIPFPQSLEDLAKPLYRGMLVVENPATSSPGLAFLLATIGHFGEEGYLSYWKDLVANDVLVVNDWNTAYNTDFTRYGGTRPIVISYSSSPPFELIFADKPINELTTAAITSNQSCFRQVEFVGILKGTTNREFAESWINFMLSKQFQEDMPMQMFVFPVNPEAQLDETFAKFLVVPDQPAFVSPAEIAKNREKWIEDWSETVLH